jgi:hypothetical protein
VRKLIPCILKDCLRRPTVVAKKAVGVLREAVARLTGVDDKNLSSGPTKL